MSVQIHSYKNCPDWLNSHFFKLLFKGNSRGLILVYILVGILTSSHVQISLYCIGKVERS